MKYEAPEMTALTPAINVIQGHTYKYPFGTPVENVDLNEAPTAAYEDWE